MLGVAHGSGDGGALLVLQSPQRRNCRRTFRTPLALASAPPKLATFVKNGALEAAIVVWPAGKGHFIVWRFRGPALQEFLKLTFWIVVRRNQFEVAEGVTETTQDEFTGRHVASIHENSPDDCLECIRQRRRALTTAVGKLTAAHDQVIAEGETTRLLRERALIDELRAGFRERTLPKRWKLLEKLPREHKAQHGVPEKLEALVVLDDTGLLVGDRRVCQRCLKQLRVSEAMPDLILQSVEIGGHGYVAAVSATAAGCSAVAGSAGA